MNTLKTRKQMFLILKLLRDCMLFANVMFVLGLRRMTFAYYQSIGVLPTVEAGECQRFKSENSIKHLLLSSNTKMRVFLVPER